MITPLLSEASNLHEIEFQSLSSGAPQYRWRHIAGDDNGPNCI
ncbi:unnamed protein product [Rhodiola kirilowii]